MSQLPRPRALRRPGQSVLRNETVFIGLPRGNGGSSSSPPSPPALNINPPETVTYVAPNGSDTTGQQGNPLLPFATLQAAVNAVQSGDTILVAPGTYADAIAIPPTLSLSIIGLGQVDLSNSGPVITWSPAPGEPRRLQLKNLRFTTNSSPALVVNRTDVQEGHTVLVEECFCNIQDVFINLYFEQVGLIVLNENQANLSLYNSQECYVNNILSDNCFFVADNSLLSTNNRILVNGGYIDQILQQNRSVVLYEGVTAVKVVANVTDDGAISFHGTTTEMTINFGVLTGTNQLDISRSKIGDLVVVAANSSEQTVDARGSEISSGVFNALGTAEAVLDTRGGSLEKTAFTFSGPNAAWDRLFDAVLLTGVPPSSSITETYQNEGGNLPKAGWPTGTIVAYQFQIMTPPAVSLTTRVDVINGGTNAKQVTYENGPPDVRNLYLTMHRVTVMFILAPVIFTLTVQRMQ